MTEGSVLPKPKKSVGMLGTLSAQPVGFSRPGMSLR